MADGGETLSIRLVEAIERIPASAWDRCAGSENPFVSHAFLQALEASASVSVETGWLPRHLVLEDAAGQVLGVVPAYLKGHSYGEYVFDHGWADAYERAGGRYYPKLQIAVPFTPVPGPRLLVPAGPERARRLSALAGGLVQITEEMGLSSCHVTFAADDDVQTMRKLGFLIRDGEQFHWHNRGYAGFDDFLGALASRKRKMIRKEREAVRQSGIEVRALRGADIKPRHWDAFFRFYTDTYDRKWGAPYLTRAFFDIAAATLPDKVVLMMAERNGTPVAGALNLVGRDSIYGRNWGCAGDFKFLHFEACYYQAIDYAIAHKLARVEAGTQGPHKIQRGYLPVLTHSAHYIRDPQLKAAIDHFLGRERRALAREMAALAELSPYRQDGQD